MRRLLYLVLAGCFLIVVYGVKHENGNVSFFTLVSVGMLAGGAALVSGGLLGFIFGVPHTGDKIPDASPAESSSDPEKNAGKSTAHGSQTNYRPNTSLEQISDWLTKMLIGVGLVELKVIPGKLRLAAQFFAKGLGGDTAEAFSLAVLVYFSVCGFVFGFLWSRLYLPRWFREADEVQALGEKLDRIEAQQQADTKALGLVNRQLNPESENSLASQPEVDAAIKAASQQVKVQIFNQAQKVSGDRGADDYDVKILGAISVFRGLIASDKAGRYHRNHSELAYALRRQGPPDWEGAEKELTTAIEIRDRMEKKGWKSYEFQRARSVIAQDANVRSGRPSDAATSARILPDLRSAARDEKSDKWFKDDPDDNVTRWMQLNNITLDQLRQP